MKQLLSLALALIPCLAWAQYPSNGNQKITLGEQTTADGLVYRGLAADTTRKPSVDTMAYIILDTTTNLLWHYKKATSNKWLQAGGSTLDTATMLLPYYRSGRNTIIQASDVPTLNQNTTGSAATLTTSRTIQTNLASTSSASFNGSANITPGVTGTLPVANGGTGSATQNFVDLTATQTIAGAKTFSNAATFSSSVTANATSTFSNSSGLSAIFSNGGSIANYNSIELRGGTAGTAVNWQISKDNSTGNAFELAPSTVAGGTIYGSPVFKVVNSGAATFSSSVTAQYIYDNTDAGAANVFVTTGGLLKRSTSSIKYKTEVEDYTKGLSDVLKLRPVTYKSINSNDNKIYAGFIAEELSDLKLSELLQNNEEGEPDAISYAYIVTLLTKAIQDQNALIKALEKRILTLENK